jgi:hypothetical protein
MHPSRMTTRRGMIAIVLILAIDLIPATRSARADEPFFPDLVFDTDREHNGPSATTSRSLKLRRIGTCHNIEVGLRLSAC